MAASEQVVEIMRGSQRQIRLRRRVDPDDYDAMQEVAQGWLRSKNIDPELWENYTVTCLTPSRLVEVPAA